MVNDIWEDRTRQLRQQRAEMASKITPPHEESSIGLGLVLLGFSVLYVLAMWLEAA
jgi:hypothetical protein